MRIEAVVRLVLLAVLTSCTQRAALQPTAPRTSAPVEAVGGTEIGPGGDNLPSDSGSAWFADASHREIRICFVSSADFGYERKDLGPLIERVFASWREYIREKKIVFPTPLVVRSLVRESCEGDEDLVVHFGHLSAELARAKRSFVNPTAFPLRTSFHHGWGKGHIWIAPARSVLPSVGFPDWGKRGALTAILRHEIGHALGFTHIPGTVMALDIGRYLQELPAQVLELGIDYERELVHCSSCRDAFRATLTEAQIGKFAEVWRKVRRYSRDDEPLPFEPPVTALFAKQPLARHGQDIEHTLLLRDRRGDIGYGEESPERPLPGGQILWKGLVEEQVHLFDLVHHASQHQYIGFGPNVRWGSVPTTYFSLVYNAVSPVDGKLKAVQLFLDSPYTDDGGPLVWFAATDRITFETAEREIERVHRSAGP